MNVHQSVFDRRALLLLKVTIDETGLVHNPAIFRSSGFPDFDKAVLACADGQHQEPPVINGQPTSADAVVGYFLDSPTHPFSIALTTGGIAICDVRKYPRSEMRLWHQGVATLSYRVAVDGSTKDITVLDSTGHPVLDDLSKDCIAAWRFFPFTKEGQPAEIQRVNRIYWILSMSPPPPGSAK